MKWTPKMEDKLRKLCFEDKSNAEIAATMHIHINDVYAKRSQLGITIPEIEAAKAIKPTDPWAPVEVAFDRLDMALLDAAAVDPINKQALRQVAGGISVFKSLLLDAMR